jgi:hypothetical protein
LLCNYLFLFQPQPQYPNINFPASMPPPPPSSNAPRFDLNADNNVRAPFNDPFPQVPNAQDRSTPPAARRGSDDPSFDDLERRFADLKNRK